MIRTQAECLQHLHLRLHGGRNLDCLLSYCASTPNTYSALNKYFLNRCMFSLKCDVPALRRGSSHQRLRWGWGELLGLASSQAIRCDLLFSRIICRLPPSLTPVLPLLHLLSTLPSPTYGFLGTGGCSGRSFSRQICLYIQVTTFLSCAAELVMSAGPARPQISVLDLIPGPYKLFSPRNVWPPLTHIVFIWCHS